VLYWNNVGLIYSIIFIFYVLVPAGRAFGTRFFICLAGQIKRAQTMPLSLTQ